MSTEIKSDDIVAAQLAWLNALERDAARYRWLRNTGAVFTVRASGIDGNQCNVLNIGRPACGLDEAIDAALSAEPK